MGGGRLHPAVLLVGDRVGSDVLSLTATQATEISGATVTISNANRSVRGRGDPLPYARECAKAGRW